MSFSTNRCSICGHSWHYHFSYYLRAAQPFGEGALPKDYGCTLDFHAYDVSRGFCQCKAYLMGDDSQ